MCASKKSQKTEQGQFKDVLVLSSDPKQIAKVETFLEKVNTKLRLGETQFHKLLVATTEAVNNGIIHGNLRNPKKKVVLSCELINKMLIVIVEDEGAGINPEKLPDPLSKENLLRENGRGVFLMQSMMDEVIFERVGNCSAVIMKMKVQKR